MPNALDPRFNGEDDTPPGAPTYTSGPLAVTRATPTAPAGPTFAERAKAHLDKALAGMSSLLGRAVTPQPVVALPTPIPNIIATVPQMARPTPPPPVPAPRGKPEPFALNTWLAQQTSK